MKTDYEQQAENFLTKYGLTFKAVYVSPECPKFCEQHKPGGMKRLPCGGVHGGKYQIEFERKSPVVSLRFDFWNSYNDEYQPADDAFAVANKAPGNRTTLFWESWYKQAEQENHRYKMVNRGSLGMQRGSLIAKPPTAYGVLAGMASDANCPDTFEDWCNEYGYDADSRKAESAYKSCKDHAFKLVKFFTTEELAELAEIN